MPMACPMLAVLTDRHTSNTVSTIGVAGAGRPRAAGAAPDRRVPWVPGLVWRGVPYQVRPHLVGRPGRHALGHGRYRHESRDDKQHPNQHNARASQHRPPR